MSREFLQSSTLDFYSLLILDPFLLSASMSATTMSFLVSGISPPFVDLTSLSFVKHFRNNYSSWETHIDCFEPSGLPLLWNPEFAGYRGHESSATYICMILNILYHRKCLIGD